MLDNSKRGNNGVTIIAVLFGLSSAIYQVFGAIFKFDITKNDLLSQFTYIGKAWNKHVANLVCETPANSSDSVKTEGTSRTVAENV